VPCHRCGARQVDPVRGPSPWRRGVRDGRQVLVCPDCQRSTDWTADLDACPDCGSTVLVKRLGDVVCRDCGASSAVPEDAAVSTGGPAEVAEVADDVRAALDRLFGR